MSVFQAVHSIIRKIRLFVFSIIITIIFLVVYIPVFLFRHLAAASAKIFRKDLKLIIASRNSFFAAEDLVEREKNAKNSSGGHCHSNFVVKLEFSGKLSAETIKTAVNSNIFGNDNYKELQHYPQKFMGFLFWKLDENFSIENHIRILDSVTELCDGQPQINLNIIMKNLIKNGWPKDKSPWEILIYTHLDEDETNCQNEKTSIFFRIHCSLADANCGFQIVQKIFACLPCTISRTNRKLSDCLLFSLRLRLFGLYLYLIQFKKCREKRWHATVEFARQRFFVFSDKITLESLNDLQERHKISLTAVILTILSEGMRKHFLDVDMGVPDKMGVTLSIHNNKEHKDGSKLQNQLTYYPIKFPVDIGDTGNRMKKLDKYTKNLNESVIPTVSWNLETIFGNLFTHVQPHLLGKHMSTSTTLCELTGPKYPVTFNGHKLLDITAANGHLNRNSGFAFTAITYNGFMRLGLSSYNCIISSEYEARKVMEKIHASLETIQLLKSSD